MFALTFTGPFKFANGTVVANGSLILTLSSAATIISTGGAAPTSYTFNLDANGNGPTNSSAWGNAELSVNGIPGTTFYTANVWSGANGTGSLVSTSSCTVGPSAPYVGTLFPNLVIYPLINVSTVDGVTISGTPTSGQVITATSGIAAAWQTPTAGSNTIPIGSHTTTSYTVVNGDQGKLLTFSNSSAVAVTLPQAGSGGNFASGWAAYFDNRNTGTVTITPTTSTIDGASSLALAQNCGALIASDGTNYFTMRGNIVNAFSAVSHQFLTSLSSSGVFTAAQPSAADLSNGTTGTGGTSVVLATSPTITTPTISGNLSLGSSSVEAWNSDTGLSRLGAASLALGNGTASDTSANLSLNRIFTNTGNCNVTPVTVTGVTTQTNAMSITLAAGELNTAGRWVHVICRGITSSGATGGSWAVKLLMGSTALITQSYNLGNNITNKPWSFMIDVACVVTGTSGTLEVASQTLFEGIATDAQSNTATVGTFDLTASQTLTLAIIPSQSTTSTTQRFMGVSKEN